MLALSFAAAQDSIPDNGPAESALTIQPEPLAEQSTETENTIVPDVITGPIMGNPMILAPIEMHSIGFPARLGIALAIIALQILLIWLVWHKFFGWLEEKIVRPHGERIKPFAIHKIKLLNVRQITHAVHFLLRIVKYILTAFQLFITIPAIFSLFSPTRHLAYAIFGYVLHPLHNIFWGIIHYIPNLITIIIIIMVIRFLLKMLKFFSIQISKGKVIIPGFYADWAAPTYKILQVLLWAFTIALVYPHLPGADSRIFQGVSVFVGIIFSFGSSSAIANLVAGLIITYMRPFKVGDRVQIKEVIGFVVEKNLMVVRLKTHKNEYVTFPNLVILNSSITNYHISSYEDTDGLIIYTEITFGYATPWQTVHEILINAALATDHVLKTPAPYVLQTGLDDFYARYQINCYTKEIDRVPMIYTQLYENIQNGFREAGMDMTAPHFRISKQG